MGRATVCLARLGGYEIKTGTRELRVCPSGLLSSPKVAFVLLISIASTQLKLGVACFLLRVFPTSVEANAGFHLRACRRLNLQRLSLHLGRANGSPL